MQVPNGTGLGVMRSKRPLLACHTRCKCSMETSGNWVIRSKSVIMCRLVRCQYSVNCLNNGRCHCIWSGPRIPCNISDRDISYCLTRYPTSLETISSRYPMPERHIRKNTPQNKTFIRGASPGIPYEL